MAPTPELAGLGYVGIRASDPLAFRDFATTVCGLEPALIPPGPRRGGMPVPTPDTEGVAEDGSVFLKMDRRQWRVAAHPCAGGEQGLDGDALQVVAGALEHEVLEVPQLRELELAVQLGASAFFRGIRRNPPEEALAAGVELGAQPLLFLDQLAVARQAALDAL